MNNITNPVEGYVYLIWAVGTPRYKVGKSKNPSKRLESLNQQSCYPLKLIESCYFDNCDWHEKRLHRVLSRWRKHGEWFEIPQTLLFYTQSWFHNPKCDAVQGVGEGTLVIYTGKQKTPTKKILLEDLQQRDLGFKMVFPKYAKLPKTLESLDKVINLLGNFTKVQQVKGKTNYILSEIQLAIGVIPSSIDEAMRWKTTLKQIRKNKKEDNA